MKFNFEKNGYNKSEVDAFIAKLEQNQIEAESKISELSSELEMYESKKEEFEEKGNSISVALTAAVEKAKQIEKSSKNVYVLKIQQLNMLYKRWENLLDEMLTCYPIEECKTVKSQLEEFEDNIKNILKSDYNISSLTTPVSSNNDSIRLLLSRIQSYANDKEPSKKVTIERSQPSADILAGQSEVSRLEEKAPLIKPIYKSDKALSKGKQEELLDLFMSENPEETIYAKKFSGQNFSKEEFDLKEAVNPTEDLEEIMKAFDFYNDDSLN